MSSRYTPEPSQIDYHADLQAQRVARAMKLIDPGDVLSIIDSRIAAEADPRAHPIYNLVCWVLDKHVAPLGGVICVRSTRGSEARRSGCAVSSAGNG
jgi:hypothetical protein